MADISRIKLNDEEYNIKDARTSTVTIKAEDAYSFSATEAYGMVVCDGMFCLFAYKGGNLRSYNSDSNHMDVALEGGKISIDNGGNYVTAYAILYIME